MNTSRHTRIDFAFGGAAVACAKLPHVPHVACVRCARFRRRKLPCRDALTHRARSRYAAATAHIEQWNFMAIAPRA